MLFNTVQYFAFFFVVAGLFYYSPDRMRKFVLLLASYFFYAYWNWKFVPLLLGLTIVDYFAAIWIADTSRFLRRFALFLSVGANLGFLAFFKYFNFLASNLAVAFRLPTTAFWHDIVLPLGISFHTFQSISYVVDVYRGRQEPVRRPIDYALYIAFFPQLVAGPIVRAKSFFSDLSAWEPASFSQIKEGSFLVLRGLVKKVALADNLAPIADKYFAFPHPPGSTGAQAWGAVFAFAMQIYFDFSGYTDMAIGFARLLGFHFPINFRRPYLAATVTDFWRRWHISLSSWLRDYLYIPLGGNRAGRWKTYRNLMLTMLLGGLWHGANWTFVIWGGFHGALLACERALGIAEKRLNPFLAIPRIAVTFLVVCVGWVFFRARTLGESITVIRELARYPRGHWPIEPALMTLICISLIASIAAEKIDLAARVQGMPAWRLAATLGCMLFLVEIFAPDSPLPFVYFQF
jgi:alginate O-acetyltransferase complex protein AlgI